MTRSRSSVPSVHAAGRTKRPAQRDASPGPWRVIRLLDAPHRLGFFVGSAMVSASALWWLATLAAQLVAHRPIHWAVAPTHAHALLMSFSFMPMFFAGFLFTAGPRWLALGTMPAHSLLPVAAAWLAGWGVFLAGVHLDPTLAATGLAVVATGWTVFVWRLAQLLRRSRVADRTHLRVIGCACGVGAAALWAAAAGLAAGAPAAVGAALAVGLWWFLSPVFATAMHRMVPFFGVAAPRLDERHPEWLLWTLLALLGLQVPFASGPLANPMLAATALVVDAGAAALVFGLALRWRATQNLRIRLLAMLNLGFVWLGLAFALQAASAAQAWFSGEANHSPIPSLHALGMGFFGSIQFAFVTRVSAGQDGRAQAIDRFAWALFLILQAAVALRLVAAWLPATPSLLLAAAVLWAFAMLAWAVRHARWYGRPRSDGRAG